MMEALIARRLGRIGFGAALCIGAIALVERAFSTGGTQTAGDGDLLSIAAAIWLVAVLIAVAVRTLSAYGIARRIARDAEPRRLFAASLIVPTVGIALLLPITLQLPIVLAVHGTGALRDWIRLAAVITGPAHAVFAVLCALRAAALAAGRPAIPPGSIYISTVLTSCLPFILLLGIPPLLVALTGIPFIPMLRGMATLADRERRQIENLPHALPRATAVPRRAA
jgi:hypothetical protein